jgi:HPt (histidine-containing phosphotransfer) domain-containing protein
MPNLNRIDGDVFRELKASVGDDFIGELIDTFLTDAPHMLAEMHRALGADDADLFRREAHSLKSNGATFGAGNLAALAKELEMMAKAGSLEGAAAKLTQLEAEYALVRDELEKQKGLGE